MKYFLEADIASAGDYPKFAKFLSYTFYFKFLFDTLNSALSFDPPESSLLLVSVHGENFFAFPHFIGCLVYDLYFVFTVNKQSSSNVEYNFINPPN